MDSIRFPNAPGQVTESSYAARFVDGLKTHMCSVLQWNVHQQTPVPKQVATRFMHTCAQGADLQIEFEYWSTAPICNSRIISIITVVHSP